MKTKSLENNKKEGKLTFEIKDVDNAFVNSVRRVIMEDVPTLAVEFCEFRENSSALYDEMLALRIGLTPIRTDLSSYRLPENDQEIEERSARCTLELSLKTSKKGVVLAELAESKDPKCTFTIPNMPLVKLIGKQKLDVVMTAVMGNGREHIKWSPGHVWFTHNTNIKINEKVALSDEDKAKFPPQAFDAKGNLSEKKIRELNLVDAVDGISKHCEVEHINNEFTVKIEAWGQLTCKEMISASADILTEKSNELISQI